LRFPVGITVDPGDRVWVADEGARKYVVYGADGSFVRDFRRPFRWAPLLRGGHAWRETQASWISPSLVVAVWQYGC
jgi:hypothetical protein